MTTQNEVKQILREEMDTRGWHDNDSRAGLAAIIGGESNFIPKWELSFTHTSNSRIRMIFGNRVATMSDAQLNAVKVDDPTWFNFIYGGTWGLNNLGNTEDDDGYNFRGGGLIQLTGRANYAKYGPMAGVDLIANPDLIIVPRIAAAVAVEYMKDRFHGGDFAAMKRAVGVSIGGPDDTKNELYDRDTQTGEWNHSPGAASPIVAPINTANPALDPTIVSFLNALQDAEQFLKSRNLYTGPIDFDPGPGCRAALKTYLASV